LRPARVSLIRDCVVCRRVLVGIRPENKKITTTRLSRKLFELMCCQIVEPDCFVNASIIPLPVLVVKTLCSKLVNDCTSNRWSVDTCGLVQPGNDIVHRPTMGSRDSGICAAFEQGGQKIAMFLALGTPICRQLLENTVVCKSN
jgi:hypothetical protein